MKHIPISEAAYDTLLPQITDVLRDWADREGSSFDEAVDGRPTRLDTAPELEDTIWDDMPAIDSKRAVDALIEIEALIGHEIPVEVLTKGGYRDADDLIESLPRQIRDYCSFAPEAGAEASDPNPNPNPNPFSGSTEVRQ